MSDRVFFATGSIDHSIRIWEAHTGNCSYVIKHTGSHVNALAFNSNRNYLLSGGYECVRLFDSQRLEDDCILQYNNLKKNTNAVGFNVDGRWFFCGGEDGVVNLFDMRSKNQKFLSRFQRSSAVNCIELHPNQHEFFIGTDSGEVNIWDIRSDKKICVTPEPMKFGDLSASIQSISLNTDATELFALSARGMCYRSILSRNSSVEQRQFQPYDILINRSNGGSRINAAGAKECVHLPHCTPHYGLHVKFSPDNTQLCVCTSDSRADIMRTTDLEVQCTLNHPTQHSWVWQAAFTADSCHVVTACSDNVARLWNLEEISLLKEYRGHQRAVTCLAFYDDHLTTNT